MSALDLFVESLIEMSEVESLTDKSIASVARKFQASLRGLAVIAMSGGSISVSDVRQLVSNAVENAYIEGMIEGGLTAEDVTADDAQMIQQIDLTQQDFIKDFVKAIRESKGDKAAQRDILDNRIPLWTKSIEAAGAQGLASAKANAMGTWKLGQTEEHCQTEGDKIGCKQLNGQRHRLKWFTSRGYIPRKPGNEAITCGGWNCDCSIVDDQGQQLL